MRSWQVVACAAAVIVAIAALGTGACHAQEAATFPVSGKVLMPDRSPAVGAVVEARSDSRETDWITDATATSGADGKFAMQLKPGSYRFCAVSGQLVCLDRMEMIDVAKDGRLSKPIVMPLDKGCKVEGTVVDKTTGQPVGGVKIITRDGDKAESSDTGAWSMVLDKHTITITAVKSGYCWPMVNFSAAGDTAKVKVEIKLGGTIRGRVLDEQGKPIAGAQVGTENTGYFSFQRAKTDADGRFALEGQDPDSKAQLWVSADGYDDLYEQPVTFASGQREAQADYTLQKTKVRTISGRVTRLGGTPVKGAKVAYGDGVNYANRVVAWTDKDGKYTIKNADADRSLVMVTCKDLSPSCKPVEADKDAQLDFQLKPGHSVEVHVEDESGNPIAEAGAGVSMKITNSQDRDDFNRDKLYTIAYATSDKNGILKLNSLPEGEVYLYLGGPGYDSLQSERLKVDRTDYTLVLRKTVQARGQISGTVVRASDGKPVTEFNVRLGLDEQGISFQAPDGKFTIKGSGLRERYGGAVVSAPGYLEAPVDLAAARTASQDTYKDIVVRLRPAHSFEGSITAAGTGAPVEGVLVTAWNSSGMDGSYEWDMSHSIFRSVSTRTDAAGKFKFDSMPFASGMVMLEKPGLARTMLKSVGFSHPLTATMEKGATVTGSIADEQGKVPPGAWLDLDHQGLNLRFYTSQSKVNSDGSFKVEDLPPGEYMIGQYKDSRSTRHLAFELKAGETYHVDWDKQGAVIVEGKVLQNGKPVPKASINVNSQERGNWAGSAEIGEDGSYKLSLLKPGTYFFSCMLGDWMDPNHIYAGKTLQLKAGANRVDFKLPYGSISGKFVDRQTGKPLAGASVRLYVHETWEQNRGRAGLSFSDVEPRWWPENECKTDKNGAFQARSLRAGEWMICLVSGDRSGAVPTTVVKLADGQAKSGVAAKVVETGSAKISFAGMKDRPKEVMVVCIDQFGMMHYPKFDNGTWGSEIDGLPVGKAKAVAIGRAWLPTEVPFLVRSDETTNVSVKLTKGSRIVFKPKSDSGDAADTVSIGFRITTADGKPVYKSLEGMRWGDILTYSPERSDLAAITVKPGMYLIKAGSRPGDSRNYGDDPELTGYSGKVTVVSGKDTVVEVPLGR